MLEEAGAIVDESARPAFSFEEAWEVFAVLTHALSGAGLPDKVRDKWAAREHDFLTSDLSHRPLQARGMRLSTPVSSAFGLGGNAFARSGHGFSSISTSCFARLPLRGPSGSSNSQIRMAINRGQWQKRPYFDLILWACLASGAGLPAAVAPAMLGADGLPRGVQIVAPSFEDRAAIACAAMLEALGASFRAPPMATP